MLIDFHYHLADADSAVQDLLADMDQSGVDRTLLMGGPTDAWWDYKQCGFAPNERVAKAVKAHADRLLGNVYLDPREAGAQDTLKRYLDQGFRAVKLFPPAGFDPNTPAFYPLYEEIERRGVPILTHTGQMNLDQLARLFPGIPFVFAHCGYPHFLEAWSVAHANPNVYLDISGSGPWTDGIPLVYAAIGGQSCIPIDFARVLWGSDNGLPQAEHIARMSTYMRQMGAGGEQRKLIFGETARKLLKVA